MGPIAFGGGGHFGRGKGFGGDGFRRRRVVRFLVRRGIPPQSDDFLIPCHPAILGPNPITKPSRRPNGEQLGPKDAPGRLVAFPSVFRPEMEAIWTSRRDLIKMAPCFVEKS